MVVGRSVLVLGDSRFRRVLVRDRGRRRGRGMGMRRCWIRSKSRRVGIRKGGSMGRRLFDGSLFRGFEIDGQGMRYERKWVGMIRLVLGIGQLVLGG